MADPVTPAAPVSPAATPAAAAPAAPAPATPPAAPAASIPPTLAGDPAAASATPNPPAKFPDNWRTLLAGDEKAAKDLEKYTDPTSVYKSLRDLQAKISKGELKAPAQPLPDNATDEQRAEWRKSNGLPDSVESMVKGVQLPEGVVIGEADKPLIEDFAKSMFEGGASQAEMNRAVGWFYQQQDRIEQQREQQDGEARIASEIALRTEWGTGDYTRNMNAMGAVLASMPEDFRATLLTARGPDGQMLGNSPAFVKAMAQLGLELNPAASVVSAGDGNAVQTIENEIKSIEKSMYTPDGKQNGAYWKDEKVQARYRELLDAQSKMGQRGRAA